MTLFEMLSVIHKNIKTECFSDIVDDTGLAPSTVWKWRNAPPLRPSLKVFVKLAIYSGLNPTAEEMEPLL